MTDIKKKAFNIFKEDFKNAKKAKTQINNKIVKGNDLYDGKTSTKHRVQRSNIVLKEVAKQIEWLLPNATEPFLSTSHPIRLGQTEGINNNKVENYLNLEFTANFDRSHFVKSMALTALKEGTAWVRDGWKTKKRAKKKTMSMEQILASGITPSKITQNKQNPELFDIVTEEMVINRPHSRVCKNEHCYPDPSATTTEEMIFFCEDRKLSLSDLNKYGTFDKKNMDILKRQIQANSSNNTSSGNSLQHSKDNKNRDFGYDPNFKTKDENRNKLSIIEYWGYYDLDEDGIAEPILAIWADKEDVLLSIDSNPMPNQLIPYHNVTYSEKLNSLWGYSLAYFLGDNQVVKTQLLRGILDNMSLANNGQKFIRQGSIDFVNLRKMLNGDKLIMVKKDIDSNMKDGSFNALPNSVFQTMSMIDKETEDLAGTGGGNSPSLSNDNIAKDSSPQHLTMAQQRMAAFVREIAFCIEKSMQNWVTMAEVFLDNSQIDKLFKQEEETDIFIFKNSESSNITIKVGTNANNMAIMQQLNMLLQQSKQLGASVPPTTFNYLVAEMFELFDLYDKAVELREFQPQPNPEQQAAQQMALEESQLKNQKLTADIKRIMHDIQNGQMNSQKAILDAQANADYKKAQTAEKYARVEEHQIDAILKPAQFAMEAQRRATEKRDNNENTRTI